VAVANSVRLFQKPHRLQSGTTSVQNTEVEFRKSKISGIAVSRMEADGCKDFSQEE
jgi:hypothetical protein